MFSKTGSIVAPSELLSSMGRGRLLHSKATAETALSLVRQYGEDIDRELCEQCGLLHDIARQWSAVQLLRYAKTHQLALEKEEVGDPVLLHAPVGAHLLQEMGYGDELCTAVRYHTLGSIAMGRLGLVLYIADYMEPGRTHITDMARKKLRALDSLDAICLEILKMQEVYLLGKAKLPAACSVELKHYLASKKVL